MIEQGLLQRQTYGDLRDIIARRFDEGGVISAHSDDTLLAVVQRMRLSGVSQLPVLADGRVIGIVDESDILLQVQSDPDRLHSSVSGAMTKALETLPPTATLSALRQVLARGLVAIIAEEGAFYGLITRFDLLNHLRRSVT